MGLGNERGDSFHMATKASYSRALWRREHPDRRRWQKRHWFGCGRQCFICNPDLFRPPVRDRRQDAQCRQEE